MSRVRLLALGCLLAASMVVPPGVKAQGTLVGTFRWQLLPYCNVITVTAVQLGAHYDIDGIDDQFGAPRAASVVGGAFINPDGSIGLGFTTVTSPGGAALHADATISLAILSGTCWHDNGVAASWEAADNYCYDQFRAGACTLAQWRSAVCRAGVAHPGASWTPDSTGAGTFVTVSSCAAESVTSAFYTSSRRGPCCLEWMNY